MNYSCKGLVADSHKKLKVLLTNVFCVTFDFYTEHLKGLYREVDDSKGIFIEKVIYRKVRSSALYQVSLFPFTPEIVGTSGSYGGTLHRNPLKLLLRKFERKILRWLGINEFLFEYNW